MTQLGITLVWCMIQVTVLAGIGLCLSWCFRSRHPQIARAITLATFAGVLMVTLLAWAPLPSWLAQVDVQPQDIDAATTVVVCQGLDDRYLWCRGPKLVKPFLSEQEEADSRFE